MPPERQSPIDIPASAPRHRHGIEWSYAPGPVRLGWSPTTVQFDCMAGGAITTDGVQYDLAGFHLHSPAEHTFAGERSSMELHLVHRAAEGRLAAVAVLLEAGEPNDTLRRVMALLAERPSSTVVADPSGLLPADRTFIAYDGSLTTPPYDEGVAWRILTTPVELAEPQIRAFRALHHGNARPTQRLGDRDFG